MNPVVLAIGAAAFVVPPVLAIFFSRKGLALLLGVLWFWAMLVGGVEYTLATDPQHDSIAPAIAAVFGWLFGVLYCVPWYVGVAAVKRARERGRLGGRARRTAQTQGDAHIYRQSPPGRDGRAGKQGRSQLEELVRSVHGSQRFTRLHLGCLLLTIWAVAIVALCIWALSSWGLFTGRFLEWY